MITQNPEYLSRDLATLEQRELTNSLIHGFRETGADFILPNLYTEEDLQSIFHTRIQRVQDLPELRPENVEVKLVSGLERLNPDRNIQQDLNKLFNEKKTSLFKGDILNEVGLSKIEQVLLARGVAIAATSRVDESMRLGKIPSQTQIKLAKAALNFINHMRTNLVRIPDGDSEYESNKFVSAYTAAYVSEIVHSELKTQNQYSSNCILAAMKLPIKFGAVLSGESDSRLSIFTDGILKDNELENAKNGFEKRHPSEIDESRIKELRKLQFSFGDENSRFTYYETTKAFKKFSKSKGGVASLPGERDKQEQSQERYAVLVIDQPDETGGIKRHAVAENKQVGNACYGLRQEVLDEWEKLIGIRLTWQDIFYPKRMIARQLGGRVFVHAKNSDVSARLLDYLNQDSDSVVYETFSKIFDTEAGLFDENMNPTSKNNMPNYFIEAIKNSTELKQLWPVIQKHGYSTTYRLFRNIENTQKTKNAISRTETARKTRLIDRALEIFEAAAKADAEDRLKSKA